MIVWRLQGLFRSAFRTTHLSARYNFFPKCTYAAKSILSSKELTAVLPKIKSVKSTTQSSFPKGTPLLHIAKLDDAYEAGGPNSSQCTLILTEGDSAKALVVAGLSQLGRDYYGVFPLRGKFLNVRETSMDQVIQNAEVQALLEILGLKLKTSMTGGELRKALRYGRIMIMTDQDHDGSHIKGLLINFFDYFWPDMVASSGFLEEFITPLIKVRRRNDEHVFFTLPEFEKWRRSDGVAATGWTVKYYKGLGTSTSTEAKQYFAAMSDHRVPFLASTPIDRQALDLVFNRKRAEDRKNWLLNDYESSLHVNHTDARLNGGLSYKDFVFKELIHFSMADNVRSIPNIMDGLKPSQRKVLYACFKKNLKSEMKVAQLAGYVAQVSAYHHGEQSLCSTIVNMAQNFVGSNNINLLEPCGQFGTRLQNGKDAASARYIFTRLSSLASALFSKDDDASLQYLTDDGQIIEPEYYVPILPLILVNGTDGIGTGWSTFVPNYNPKEIIDNIKRKMMGIEYRPMIPWYRGFQGNVAPGNNHDSSNYSVHGVFRKRSNTEIEITELPLRRWCIQSYKEFLQELCTSSLQARGNTPDKREKLPKKKKLKESHDNVASDERVIESFQEFHTDSQVHFVIKVNTQQMERLEAQGILKALKLDASLSTCNMTLFSPEKVIVKYESPEQILDVFYEERLKMYEQRREWIIQRLSEELAKSKLRMRFIEGVIQLKIKILGVSKQEAVTNIEQYLQINDSAFVESLLSLPINHLLLDKLQVMQADVSDKEMELEAVNGKSALDLWRDDLDHFFKIYEKEEKAVA